MLRIRIFKKPSRSLRLCGGIFDFLLSDNYFHPVSCLMTAAYRRDMGISVRALSFIRMVNAPAVHGATSAR